jgi:polysaccharide export outer membrane protein
MPAPPPSSAGLVLAVAMATACLSPAPNARGDVPAAADAAAAALGWADGDPPPPSPAVPAPVYRIGADDRLMIAVDGDASLSRSVLVRPDGFIALPLVGEIQASGLSPEELADRLKAALARFLVAPRVAVAVIRGPGDPSRQVRIAGAAARPQALPHRRGMRLADALIEVGGLSPEADGNAAILVRGSDRIPLALDDLLRAGDAAADLALLPGDIIIIPEGVFAGDWQRTFSLTVAGLATSNYPLDPHGSEDPALIASVTPEVTVAGKGARFEGALSAALSAQYVAVTDSGPRLVPAILATSETELVRDALYLDAALSVAELQLSTASATSAAAGNDVNRTLVQTYQVSPTAVARLGDVAFVQGRYVLAGVVASDRNDRRDRASADAEIADSLTNGVEVRISNPPQRIARLQWQGAGYGTFTRRFGDSDVTALGLTGSPRYSLTRRLSLVSIAGYSLLDAGSDRLSGPDVAAGFGYAPSPAFSLQAIGGWRLEAPQADVLLRWDPGPSTRLTASYTDSVGVGQASLVRSLSDLAYDGETRQFVDRRTQLPFAPQPSGVDIDNGLTRTQYAAATATHAFAGTTVGLVAYLGRQQPAPGTGRETGGGFVSDQTTWGVGSSVERPLDRQTTAKLGIAYAQTDQQDRQEQQAAGSGGRPGAVPGDFEDVVGSLDLVHRLADAVELAGGYRYQRRFARFTEDRFDEHVVFIAVTRRF